MQSTDLLTADQQAEAQRLTEKLEALFLQEARTLAQSLAATQTSHLLGANEFKLRDALHRLGAQALQLALAERKKGGIKAPA